MRSISLTQRVGNKGLTIIELIIVASIFLLIVGALTPIVNMARARSRRLDCANNLRAISLGLHAYAADHNDFFPATLGELYPRYVGSEKAFDCPATKKVGTKEVPDYRYITALTEFTPPKEMIAEDLDGNHKTRGRNILRVNGSVAWAGQAR